MNVEMSIDSPQAIPELAVSLDGTFIISQDQTVNYPKFKSTLEWSLKEKVKFLIFINKNADKFTESGKMEKWNLFKTMSKFIKTRNCNQCRSYHTRIMRQFKTIATWTKYLQETNRNFQKFYDSYVGDLDIMNSKAAEATDQQSDKTYVTKPVDCEQKGLECQSSPVIFLAPNNILKLFYPGLEAQRKRQEDFRQCHRLFLEWRSKMQELQRMGIGF